MAVSHADDENGTVKLQTAKERGGGHSREGTLAILQKEARNCDPPGPFAPVS